jgi:hypothetical protein
MNFRVNMITSRPAPDDVNGADGFINWAASQVVTFRLGCPSDDLQLRRLAMLDSSRSLRQPILIAELDGAVVAALSLSTGAGVADPSQRSAGLVELLRVRACQLAMSDPTSAAA